MGAIVGEVIGLTGPAGKRARPLLLLLCIALGAASPVAAATDEEHARIVHLLSRAAYGPTPELVEEVRAIGPTTWLAQQIEPERIADPELERRLSIYPALAMSAAELFVNYPRPDPGEPPQGIGRPPRIVAETQAALVTRATHARAQLREVLTDFWFNHFNVFAGEGPMPYLTPPYLRDAIRPNVFGRFEDLLRATATSPAMLYYLDNYASSRARRRRGGINENYARELLELHTLGTGGGYTQADVIEVAHAFTGWTISPPESASPFGFLFRDDWHQPGDKQVLSTTIPSGGREEGDRILGLLARDPATAELVSRKLVTRLVSDTPPEALVARIRDVYLATDGQLGWVVIGILSAAEFYDPVHRGAKVKSPLELVASALRAAGARVNLGVAAARLVGDLGQGLLLSQPPTGWPEVAAEILSPGGMVSRFDLAYRVASGGIDGVAVDVSRWNPIVREFGVRGLSSYLLGREPSASTLAALEHAYAEGAGGTLLAALVLASPEFQQQ
jgi:uncharacterized protein (DUF1800 family)